MISLVLCLGAGRGAERDVRVRFTAFAPDPGVRHDSLRVSAGGSPAHIVSAASLSRSRQLLIVIDPTSYSSAEIRRRVGLFGKALAASSPERWTIRLGIPMLAGVLGPPIDDPQRISSGIDRTVTAYLTDQSRENPISTGRIIDLISQLVEKAEGESGPVDCLLLFRDRRIAGDDAAYLNYGLQRRLAGSALRTGSTFYGWLEGEGILRDACVGGGGLTWTAETPPEQVLRQLAEARNRGIVLESEVPLPAQGRELHFDVSGSSTAGDPVGLRAPSRMWLHPDGSEPPDHYRMQQGLDWVRRARQARIDENLTLARQFAENAIKSDSWNPEGYYLAAESAEQLGDLPAAGEWAERAIAAVGPDERVLLVLGSAYRRLGKPAEALQRLQMFRENGSPLSPGLRLELARLHAAAGQYEAARELYADVLTTGLRDASLLADYGETLLRLGSAQEARRQFLLALEYNPSHVKALNFLAHSAAAAGQVDEAREWARKAVERNPRDPDAHAGLAAVEAQLEEWDQASESLQMALILSPDRQDIRRQYVEILCRAGRQREAIAFLRKSLESNPDDAAGFPALAEVLSRIGEIGQAARAFEIGAARGAPDACGLYRRAAELRERRGEYGQALLDYRAMFRVLPGDQSEQLKSELDAHLSALSILIQSNPRLQGNSFEKELMPDASQASLNRERDASLKAAAKGAAMISVPGGLTLLSRSLGFGLADAKEPDLLEQIFSFILDGGQQSGNGLQDNPIRRGALSTLRNYAALIQYLDKKGLLSGDFNPKKPQEAVFPLFGSPETIRRAQSLLNFFRVKLEAKRAADGAVTINLILKQGNSARARQEFLRHMGVNLTDRRLREIRLTLGDEDVPILLQPEVWNTRIFRPEGKKSVGLLERFFLTPRAMRLYVVLAGCSTAARDGLTQAFNPGELLDLVEVLSTFGRQLDFENGHLVFPGMQQSWIALIGNADHTARSMVAALVRKDDWRAMRIYASLARAPSSVQQYLTATPERLKELHQAFTLGSSRRETADPAFRPADLSRILGLMTADERGLLLPIDGRLAGIVLPGAAPQQTSAAGAYEPLRIPIKQLGKFLEWVGNPDYRVTFSPLETIELLVYLQATHPDMLDEEAASLLMRNPAGAPAILDVVMDLSPPAALLRRYLSLAEELAGKGPAGWGVSRMRTSQSLIYLISLLHRQGALSRDEGLKLLGIALDRLRADEEPAFAWGVADFLSSDLLPLLNRVHLGASPDELLLEGLAGPHVIHAFDFEGKWLQLDAAAYQHQRMQAAILQQRYATLSRLLEAFQAMDARARESGNLSLDALNAVVEKIQAANVNKTVPGRVRQAGDPVDAASLMRRLTLLSRGKQRLNLPQLASEIASVLHTELGVTLLTYCYAYHGAPEIDIMAFDPDTVRKHDFFGGESNRGGAWAAAHLEQKGGVGSYLTGSISGLGFELSRLETAQWSQSLGEREGASLIPTILAGMRLVRRADRSDRAQEYVALSVQLGRELLARASLEAPMHGWCESFLNARLLPRRLGQLRDAMASGNARLAVEIVSPSELFLLGQGWLLQSPGSLERNDVSSSALSGGNSGVESPANTRPPAISSPVLSRLRAILPPPGTREWGVFRRELEQYGIMLRRRLGINQLTAGFGESYEQLEGMGGEEVLQERICDLKIRMAELHYQLGIPAFLAEVESELALRDILPGEASVRSGSWKLALRQISRLGQENSRGWIEQLLARGILAVPETGTEAGGLATAP